tara:strand:- start:102 stop:260 length:159 start_codon:yes stop_codon:yes gene_type:complete
MVIAMEDGQGSGMSLESYEEDGNTVFKLSLKNAMVLHGGWGVAATAAAVILF